MSPLLAAEPVVVLAHHPLVTALPFFVPALLVVGVVGAVVWRDRHAPLDDEADDADGTDGLDDRAGASGTAQADAAAPAA